MTKEEKIKEAWGELWHSFNESAKKCALNKDGYVASILQNGLNKDFTEFNASLVAWRPKSLQGIEDNNGWIKVESEADLPKDSYNYWIFQNDGLIQSMKEYELNKKYYNIRATHYQQIEKPKPPLYYEPARSTNR